MVVKWKYMPERIRRLAKMCVRCFFPFSTSSILSLRVFNGDRKR
jgi:hypothetical protein